MASGCRMVLQLLLTSAYCLPFIGAPRIVREPMPLQTAAAAVWTPFVGNKVRYHTCVQDIEIGR